ncbi:hypothetical protein ACFWY9_31690 [Amycolatopsis sp. NPDC059027]|uniref:hypothetical protein n=1 Tax=unclassified Amycolatopsis TaxID=2618356 RepID=UPI00366B1D75
MAVRLTSLFRREQEHTHTGRRAIAHELRNRFGFSLIQAPLRKQPTLSTELDLPEPRAPRHDPIRTTRPLETQIDLSQLLPRHLGSHV